MRSASANEHFECADDGDSGKEHDGTRDQARDKRNQNAVFARRYRGGFFLTRLLLVSQKKPPAEKKQRGDGAQDQIGRGGCTRGESRRYGVCAVVSVGRPFPS
ncbi:MAG TPA: hypothetical protein PKN56_08670, partial [Leptospiraceae bacterium]|nr:hypothetical protein [Leptospiraceae bacterium]